MSQSCEEDPARFPWLWTDRNQPPTDEINQYCRPQRRPSPSSWPSHQFSLVTVNMLRTHETDCSSLEECVSRVLLATCGLAGQVRRRQQLTLQPRCKTNLQSSGLYWQKNVSCVEFRQTKGVHHNGSSLRFSKYNKNLLHRFKL